MYLADALSRAYLPYDGSQKIAGEFESVNMIEDIPMKPATLQEVNDHTEQDEVLQELMKMIKTGWPESVQLLDLYSFKGRDYLISVDYYSSF